MTCYYHLREAPTSLISADQYVAEGDLIGYVGNTGKVVAINGDGSHLHFEVNGDVISTTRLFKNCIILVFG